MRNDKNTARRTNKSKNCIIVNMIMHVCLFKCGFGWLYVCKDKNTARGQTNLNISKYHLMSTNSCLCIRCVFEWLNVCKNKITAQITNKFHSMFYIKTCMLGLCVLRVPDQEYRTTTLSSITRIMHSSFKFYI